MYIVAAYLAYLAISLAVTIWVARTLHHNGRFFLVVGFYLINFGYVTLALRTSAALENSRQAIELVSDKVGLVLLVLGLMHFFNLYVFSRMRKRSQESAAPPFPPDMQLGV